MSNGWANGFLNSYANQLYAVTNPVRDANVALTEADRERRRLQSELALRKSEDELYKSQTQHEAAKVFSKLNIREIQDASRAVIPGTLLDFGTWFGGQALTTNMMENLTGKQDTGFFGWFNDLFRQPIASDPWNDYSPGSSWERTMMGGE